MSVKDEENKTHLDIIMRTSTRIDELMNEVIKCQQEKNSGMI